MRGRPKRTWDENIEKDIDNVNLTEEMALNRAVERKKVHRTKH